MIISCGEALVDLVPEPVPGGGPMNAAIAARRLGAPTAFVGRISNDRHWQEIWRFLTENDVDTRACERGDEQTARAIVEHVPHLVFRFEGDHSADTMLEAVAIDRLGPGPHIIHGAPERRRVRRSPLDCPCVGRRRYHVLQEGGRPADSGRPRGVPPPMRPACSTATEPGRLGVWRASRRLLPVLVPRTPELDGVARPS